MTNQLSNWGRWGTEDEQGALNLITADLIKQVAGLIRTGKVYSLTMPLEAEGPQWPIRHTLGRPHAMATTQRMGGGQRYCEYALSLRHPY